MTRPLARALISLCLASAPACAPAPETPRFDNVVLVTIDTLRADHLGCYGYPRPTSPFIDSLAEDGLRFGNALAASSHTAPSHATMLTALYPEQHGVLVNGFSLPQEIVSLAPLARSAGRETAGFVSVRFLKGLNTGFEAWDSEVVAPRLYRGADATVERVLDWLGRRDAGRPFALWVHFYDVHEHKASSPLPPGPLALMERDSARNGPELLAFLRQQRGYGGDRVTRNYDRYDAQIAFVDAELRRLYEAVEAHADGRRTLWAITADHGEGMGDHDYGGHGRYLYEEQIHVPLILHSRAAGLRRGVIDALVRHVDLLPTVAELIGVELPTGARIEGRSLAPLLSGTAPPETIAFAQRRPPDERRLRRGWHPGQVIVARDERYKYISNSHGPDEFYDLLADPHEHENLAGQGGDRERSLRAWLLAKFEELMADRRVDEDQEIPEEMLEELRALGYI